MNFLDLLIRMPHEKISKATVKPKYFMHIAATAQRLATGWKSGMIYVSESHVSYCPLPHPGNSANSCQLIFGKEGRNKGLILCVCVQIFKKVSEWCLVIWRNFVFMVHIKSFQALLSILVVNRWTFETLFRRPSMPLRIDEVQQDIRKVIQRSTFSNAESSKLRGKASEKIQSHYSWLMA